MGLELYETIAGRRKELALATVLHVQGSAPRHPGARMLVGHGGLLAGTVGGGRGEALALEACRRCLHEGRPELLRVEMVGTEVLGPDMVCGGVSTLLIEPLDDKTPYRLALERLARGERVLFVKRIVPGEPGPVQVEVHLLDENGGPIHGRMVRPGERAAAQALDKGQPWLDAEAGVFYDPVFPEEKLLILGGGHVGQALAVQAATLDFAVTVVDDRPESFDSRPLPEGVRTVVAGFERAIAAFPFDSATYAVVVTRGHAFDLECVRAILKRPYRYAGFMGSSRKTRLILDQVLRDGFDPAKVAALCGPIGLDIGAETPAELATAILGELVAHRRNARILAELRRAREGRRA
jgi:xanthine dehydrogenase accessory factor